MVAYHLFNLPATGDLFQAVNFGNFIDKIDNSITFLSVQQSIVRLTSDSWIISSKGAPAIIFENESLVLIKAMQNLLLIDGIFSPRNRMQRYPSEKIHNIFSFSSICRDTS